MSLKERATKEFKEKIDSDEEIRESILTVGIVSRKSR